MRKSSQAMACTIRLSEPLLKLRSRKELVETLLHEMIHAWNFVHSIYEENGGHGKSFKAKMEEINRKAGTNITVYHSFHDEVELYKKHWWRCEGPCRTRKPYFGYVKRVSNRAPGKNDFWWPEHEKNCGGKFIKVKEPEKTEKKKKETKKSQGNHGDIRKYFPNLSSQSSSEIEDEDFETDDRGFVIGTPPSQSPKKKVTKPIPRAGGTVLGGKGDGKSKLLGDQPSTSSGGGVQLGGAGNGRSRLLDMFEAKKKPIETKPIHQPAKKIKFDEPSPSPVHNIKVEAVDLTSPPPLRKSIYQAILSEFDDDDIILLDDEFDDNLGDSGATKPPVKTEELCHCPICNQAMKMEEINNHLDECLTLQVIASP